jgi:uncharacterized repeat protein (TIGR01451 family)
MGGNRHSAARLFAVALDSLRGSRWLGARLCGVIVAAIVVAATSFAAAAPALSATPARALTHQVKTRASGLPGAAVTAARAAASVPPPSFTCLTPTIFVAQGTTATQLYGETYVLGSAVFTPIGAPWTGSNGTTRYNAIGFNTADRLIYGVSEVTSSTNNDLLQIGSDGSVNDLGVITGLPTNAEFINNGAFFNGDFYIMSYNTQTVYKVDLATLVATAVPLSQVWSASDFTQIGNSLWGLSGSNFERLDPATGQVSYFPNTILSVTGGAGGGDSAGGAVFTFGNGNFGVSSSDTGVVSQVSISDPDSATPVITLVSQSPGPVSQRNDGASCVPALDDTDLSIAKSGPAQVLTSGTITWTLNVSNAGPAISSGYTVTDQVPAGVTNVASSTAGCTVAGNDVTCVGPALLVGDTNTITITGTAPSADGSCVTNIAAVLANENDPDQSNNTSGPVQTCTIASAAPAITVAKSTTTAAVTHAGQVIPYDFLVTNAGNVTLDHVAVTDTVAAPSDPAGLSAVTCPDTTLAPSVSTTCTATYTATQADVDHGGPVDDSATATGTPPSGPAVTSAPSPASVPVTQAPAVTVAKSTTTVAVTHAGQVIPYSFLVTNTGNVTLDHVTVTDTVTAPSDPAGLSAVTCLDTTLAPEASTTCTASYTATQADIDHGSVDDSATVTGTPPATVADPTPVPLPPSPPSPVSVPVTRTPAITVAKSTTTAAVTHAGQVIPYDFLVTNAGNETLTGVTVTDTVAAPSDPAGLSTVICADTTLAPGATTTCTATYTATQADVDHGSVHDSATATGAPPSGPAVTSPPSRASVPVTQTPALSVVKSAPSAEVHAAGDVIGYAFLVTNTGNVMLDHVAVTDTVAAPSDPANLSPVTCPDTTLAPGASTTCTATYTVTQADIDNGSVIDSAAASGTPPSGPPVTSPPSAASVPAPANPGINIVKSATPALVHAAGDMITYRFTVTDTGNDTLHDITVTDTQDVPAGSLDGPVSCPDTTLTPGASTTCTATYTVTQADIDNGGVSDSATASGTPPSGPAVTSAPAPLPVPAVQAPAVTVVKSAPPAPVTHAGQQVRYSFLVTDTGNVTLHDIKVTDKVAPPSDPADLSPVTCPDPSLAPGASETCTATYTATQADVDHGGPVRDTATVTGTPPPVPGSPSPPPLQGARPSAASVPVAQVPGLRIVKSAATEQVTGDPAEVIRYQFTLANTGNVTLTDVGVSDPLLAAAGITVRCPHPVLAPGKSETCAPARPYTVTSADAARGTVTNTADAHARTPSGHLIRSAPSTVTVKVSSLAVIIPTGEGANAPAPGASPALTAVGTALLAAGTILLMILLGRRPRRRNA